MGAFLLRFSPILLFVSTLACDKQQPFVVGDGQVADGEATPIESVLKFEGGTEFNLNQSKTRVWTINGQGIKELKIQMLVCKDGKVDARTQMTCTWDDQSKPVVGQLIYQLQNGESFGVRGKRIPTTHLTFISGGPNSMITHSASSILVGNYQSQSSRSLQSSGPGKEVIFSEVLIPTNKKWTSITLGSSEQDLLAAAKEDIIVVGILSEWKK